MAIKAELKERTTGEVMYPVTLSECILDLNLEVPIEHSSGTALNAEVNKYYYFDSEVDTLTITMPQVTDTTNASCFSVFLTTNNNPQITINGNGKEVSYFRDYIIDPNTTYELNFMFNGLKWIVAHATVE